MIEKIDEIYGNPVKGELYLVPCIYLHNSYIPVINHPHNDRENGQVELHYHVDDRFLDIVNHAISNRLPFRISSIQNVVYREMRCHHSTIQTSTDRDYITKSKLKHHCIYKGKCPHRGYDLSMQEPYNGMIICPLHGLRFDTVTKQLIK